MHHPLAPLSSTFLIAAAIATAGCVDDPGAEPDPQALGTAVQELGGGHASDPLIRPDGPLGRWVYDQLARSWVRWAVALPSSTHPIADETGASCGLGQAGPVWFLAGTFGGPVTRDCDVPFGKALFFPLMNTWVALPPEFVTPTEDVAFWTAYSTDLFAAIRASTCELTLRIDGRELLADTAERDAVLWTEVLDPFAVFVHLTDSIYGPEYGGGVWYPAFASGQFALFRPLSRGHHVVELGGAQCDGGSPVFETSATYHLHVH